VQPGYTEGKKGLSFDTPKLDIRAQVQHLKAYASTDALVNERTDPRFRYVKRGCAPYAEWLGQKENPQGKFTGIGVFTVVEESDGKGAAKWGLLKAYQEKRDGWISLDFTARI